MRDEQQPGVLDRYRRRYPWLDHLVRAGQNYMANNGNFYAAAITYFSVLALVPLLMIAFAVAAFLLAAYPDLLEQLQSSIAHAAPAGLGDLLADIIRQAIESRGAVGIIGLLGALYAGLGWMGNLREALTAQWEQRHGRDGFLRTKAVDFSALIGLGLALVVSFGITAVGTLFSDAILGLLGVDTSGEGTHVLSAVATAIVSIAAMWLVFLWVIAKLPREPVTARSARRAALFAAIGFEILKQGFAVYLAQITASPTGKVFGPLLGLLVFAYFVSRFLLFVTAWAATATENRAPVDAPAAQPAVIAPQIVVPARPAARSALGLVGLGVLAGALLGSRGRRRQ